jgi:hypothetical protein
MMEGVMKAFSKMASKMEMEHLYGQMVRNIKVHGRMIKCMGLDK